MSKLLKRLHRLETRLTDSHGLVPHSEKWFNYWGEKVNRFLAGEKDVDLRGISLEFIDALMATGKEAADNDESRFQATFDS